MAKQGISTGTTPNDGTGDSLLDGALKINANFTEIYDALGDGSTVGSYANFTGVVTATSFDGELTGAAVTSYSGGLTVTGVTTSSGGFVGGLTGNVTGTATTATVAVNARGLTGSPNVTVGNINVGTAITIGSGNTQTTNSIELTGTIDSVSVITDRLNSGIATFTENVYLGDSDHLYFGDGSDLDIYHSGTDNFIVGSTGVIHMRNDDIKIQSGAGSTEYARFRDVGVELYQGTYKKFETTSAGVLISGGIEATGISTLGAGVTVTGTTFTNQLSVSGVSTFGGQINPSSSGILFDSNTWTGSDTPIKLWIGNSGGARYFTLSRSNGGQVTFDNDYPSTGHNDHRAPTHSFTQTGSEYYALFNSGSVKLYHPASASGILDQKFETLGAGVTVTGTTFTNQLSVSGVSTFQSNTYVGIDTSVGVVLTSPNGTQYRLMVENDGTLATVAI